MLPIIATLIAAAPDLQGKLKNVGKAAGIPVDDAAKTDVTVVAGGIIRGLLAVMGVFFLAQTVYAGFKWMNARGEKEEVQDAKDTIQRSVIGFAIMLAAYAITSFVVGRLTEATLGT